MRTRACIVPPSGVKRAIPRVCRPRTREPASKWSPSPGGIDTAFYRDSHDYVSEDKQHTFMQPGPLAEVILFNLINEANLTVTDIEINRNS